MDAAFLSRLLLGQRVFVVVVGVLTCLFGSQASALAAVETPDYDVAGYVYDIEANIAQLDTDAPSVSAVRTFGHQGDAKPSVVSAWHLYDSSFSLVAPRGIPSAFDEAAAYADELRALRGVSGRRAS